MALSASTGPAWPEGVTLLVGVGAQKAGTSWVYHYLQRHPACRPGPMKEIHYFDTISGFQQLGRKTHARKAATLERKPVNRAQAQLDGVRRLQAICEAPDADHQSYIDLMTEGLVPGQVALDITPSYAVIDAPVFRQIAGLGDTRFLFVMREPVSRVWSAVRMQMAKKVEDPAEFEAACQERLDLMLERESKREFSRADYAGTLRRLEDCVPEGRRLVLFYENLFMQETADRICAFLGIASQPVDDLGVVNQGMRAEMRPDQATALAIKLRPQYQAVCAAFGAQVPEAWHNRFAALPEPIAPAPTTEGIQHAE